MPVDALGVGVDAMAGRDARRIFEQAYLPIRSWTVRSEECRAALLDLGVPAEKILVGADWAWLYGQMEPLEEWADAVWSRLRVEPDAPLLVANPVNMMWRADRNWKVVVASVCDELARQHGFQIAFFCNEVRDGDYFDFAAAKDVARLMRYSAVIVPNEYYTPDEAVALLQRATVTLSGRYHFSIESVFAGSVPVQLLRGQKMAVLSRELGLKPAGTFDSLSSADLYDGIMDAWKRRASMAQALAVKRHQLAERARANNLAFFHRHYCTEPHQQIGLTHRGAHPADVLRRS